jgi:hypothetical protein
VARTSGTISPNPFASPILQIVTPHAEFVVALDGTEVALGRDAKNDVQIDEGVVSARHARLVREESTYRYFFRLTNPTLLRCSHRCTSPRW